MWSDREFLCRNCGCNRLFASFGDRSPNIRCSTASISVGKNGLCMIAAAPKPDCLAFTQAVVFA